MIFPQTPESSQPEEVSLPEPRSMEETNLAGLNDVQEEGNVSGPEQSAVEEASQAEEQERPEQNDEKPEDPEPEAKEPSVVDKAWEVLQRYLKEHNVSYRVRDRKVEFATGCVGVVLNVELNITNTFFTVRLKVPVYVPKERRKQMMELITRLNFGFLLGSFQMDVRDGETFFYHATPLGDGLSLETVERTVSISSVCVANDINGIMRLMYDPQSTAQGVYKEMRGDRPLANLMERLQRMAQREE